MISIIGHDPILTTIRHQLKRDQLHHSWFFQGDAGVGKLETALWTAQGIFCEHPPLDDSSLAIACGECRSCRDIEYYRHPQLLLLTIGDRLPTISFFHEALISGQAQVPGKVVYQLRRELHQLLARHRQQLLDQVTRDKTTYREGEKLNGEELERHLHHIRLKYHDLLHYSQDSTHIPACLKGKGKGFLTDMRKLQNCLDRSVLTKDNLDRVINWCKHHTGEKKLVIIENIELIHIHVIGLFLKILEDPPPDVFFILITEDMDNLNQEVTLPLLSRCLNFSFHSIASHIDEILKEKFRIITGHLHQERNFQIFLQKQINPELSPLDFFLQPISHILSQEGDIPDQEIVGKLYRVLESYALPEEAPSQRIKINYPQALAILGFLNQNYPLIKKNNYSKVHFLVELSLYMKKILKWKASVSDK